MKDSFEQEKETPSPIKFDDIERHASFNWFGNSSSKDEQKHLTLKQLVNEVPNPVLARIAEVLEIATEKIELVKKQSSTLEEDIRKAQQATISLVPFIKGIDEAESSNKNAPHSSNDEAGGNAFQSAWEK